MALNMWLGVYWAGMPGVQGGDNGTVRLNLDSEPQPDAFLIMPTDCGAANKKPAGGSQRAA